MNRCAAGTWTIGGLARVLGVTRNTAHKYARENRLRSWKTPGGHARFQDADVQKFFQKIGFTGAKGNGQ